MSDMPEKRDKVVGMEKFFFRASTEDFKKIPGSPIVYWVTDSFLEIFSNPPLSKYFQTRLGLSTANNDRFLRNWHEVSLGEIGFGFDDRSKAQVSKVKWFPYEKGGAFRKWYGNHDFLVNWQNDGNEIRNFGKEGGRIRSHNYNLDFIFKEGITWSDVTSGTNAFRYMPKGFLFDGRGSSGFVQKHRMLNRIFGFLNSKISTYTIAAVNPTIVINVGEIARLPFPKLKKGDGIQVYEAVRVLTVVHKIDWDSYETSWDFTSLPLLHLDYRQPTLQDTYQKLRAHWQEMTLEMQRLEEENNRIFIEAYGLQDELTPEVPLNEITLTCNPYYRYGKEPQIDTDTHGSEKQKEEISVHPCSSVVQKQFPINEELEAKLLSDTIKEFISYAVGCMFGRYSLDKPGLILANQGETIEDYYRKLQEPQIDTDTHGSEKQKEKISDHQCSSVVQPTFEPDADNVIPILDGDWFIDDIVERFRIFLRTTFGEEHYEENLKFIEDAIGKDIRKYFLKNFYTDHVKRYKKRPIYWLFASPKGSFNALIYMHRYQPDTISIILNDYLREFRTKLIARREHLEQVSISASAKKTEKTKALKEIEKLKKTIEELDTYENEILYPLATQKIEIDLDDGVKVNYKKFGKALKKVVGLS